MAQAPLLYNPTDFMFGGSPAPDQIAAPASNTAGMDQIAAQFGLGEGVEKAPPGVQYSASKRAYFVPGFGEVKSDDSEALLRSLGNNDPTKMAPADGDWQGVDTASFMGFLGRIQNPGMGELASKNFGIGVDNLQLLAGAGLKAFGAEETGQSVIDAQVEDLRKSSPYQREFTGIGSDPNRGVLDWFVAVVSQQGPNIIESVVTAALGYAAGSTASGFNPITGAGGAIAALTGKSAFKKSVMEASKKYIAKETLSTAETKILKQAAGIFGAAVANTGSSYLTGVADIYNESGDRGAAFFGAFPYAAIEVLPEFLLAGRLFGDIGKSTGKSAAGDSFQKKALNLLTRTSKTTAQGALLEGGTEASQEALLLAANPTVDWDSPEGINRLINSFAAGAATGGLIGGGASFFNNEPTDLLNPNKPITIPGPQAPLQLTGPETLLQLTGPETPLQLEYHTIVPPAPLPDVIPMNGPIGPAPAPPRAPPPLPTIPPQPLRRGDESMLGIPPAPTLQEISVPGSIPPPLTNTSPVQTADNTGAPSVAPTSTLTPPFAGRGLLTKTQKAAAPETTKVETAQAETTKVVKTARSKTDSSVSSLTLSDGQTVAVRKLGGLKGFVLEANQKVKLGRTMPMVETKVAALAQSGELQALTKPEPDPAPTKPKKRIERKPADKPEAKPGSVMTKGVKKDIRRPKSLAEREEEYVSPASLKNSEDVELADAMAVVNDPAYPGEKSMALAVVMDYAYSAVGTTGTGQAITGRAENAQAYLDSELSDDTAGFGDALLIHMGKGYNPFIDGGKNKGMLKPAFQKLVEMGHLGRAVASGVITTKTISKLDAHNIKLEKSDADPVIINSQLLVSAIEAFNAQGTTTMPSPQQIAKFIALKKDADMDFRWNNRPLREYFKGTRLNLERQSDDTIMITPADGKGMYSRLSWDGASNKLDANGQAVKPMAVGQAKLLAKQFIKKFEAIIKMAVYRDQADLKARNPALYERALAARGQDDFDTADAAGYSFGKNEVIIFSDRILGKQHLEFVLAHEAVGHMGLRAVVPPGQLGAVLGDVYRSASDSFRAAVDTMVNATGMSKAEAVEEHMADMAAIIDASLLARMWNKLKSFLNKFGATFSDDTARYWLDQARRYTRNGQTQGNLVRSSAILQRLMSMESGYDVDNVGRFSIPSHNLTMHKVSNMTREFGYDPLDALGVLKGSYAKLKGHLKSFQGFMADLKLTNYLSRENEGFAIVYQAFEVMAATSKQKMDMYNRMMKTTLNRAVELGSTTLVDGSTKAEIHDANLMMLHGTESRQIDNYATVSKLPDPRDLADIGNVKVDLVAVEKLKEMGRVPVDMIQKGYEYQKPVHEPITDADKAAIKTKRDKLVAAAGTDERKEEIRNEYKILLGQSTVERTITIKVPAMPHITEDSPAYKMYREMLDTMAQANIDRLMSHYAQLNGKWEQVFQRIAMAAGKGDIGASDRAFLIRMRDHYLGILSKGGETSSTGTLTTTPEAAEAANKFIADLNAAIIGKDVDRYDQMLSHFPAADRDIVRADMVKYKSTNRPMPGKSTKFTLQQEIENLAVLEQSKESEAHATKKNIASGYAPLIRVGDWQLRVIAVDATTGKEVVVDENIRSQFSYHQFVNEERAAEASKQFDEGFEAAAVDDKGNPTDYVLPVLEEGVFVNRKVKLKTRIQQVQQERIDPGRGNIHEFARFITQFNIQIRPEKREQIVRMMTAQNDRMRKGFRREGVPGASTDMVLSVSQYLEAAASIIARNTHMHKIDTVMDAGHPHHHSTWYGDENKYQILKSTWEAAKDNDAIPEMHKKQLKLEFLNYHRTYKLYNAPGKGGFYLDKAAQLIGFVQKQRDIAHSDFATTGLAGELRTLTVVAQLGGSIATGALNLISLPMNLAPMLASFNEQTGFGGGFGMSRTVTAMLSATSQVGSLLKGDAKYYLDLTGNDPGKSNKRAIAGLSEADVKFVLEYITSGRGDAAAYNGLMATTRGKQTSGLKQKFIEMFMSPFTSTEQSSRRIGGLAAFRLRYEDNIAAFGKDESQLTDAQKDQAFKEAQAWAQDTVDAAIGQYANFGMPAAFRGGIQQFLFMYKVFPVTTGMLLSNLSRGGKLGLLTALIAMGGLKGVPFSEDIMDILDTLSQKLLGLKIGSVEAEFYKMADGLVPGLGKLLASGLADQFTPGTISTRTQTGNIIPGTSWFLPYADKYQELKEVLGPVFSAMEQYIATANSLAKYGLETVGLKDDVTDFNSILRESPVTILRALSDSAAYYQHGAIVNRRGYVVSPDLHFGTHMMRWLGFYPQAATEQYDAIALGRRIANYNKDVTMGFRMAWLKARATGNISTMRHVEKQVREWNEFADPSMQVKNFRKNANKAYQSMKQTVGSRSLKATPKHLRPETKLIMDMFE